MPRSRNLRALAAASAGIVGAGSVVCATMAYTHAAHHPTRVASLGAVPEVGGAPRAAEPAAGLLAWQAPKTPSALELSPLVLGSVRVVMTTRYVKAGATPAPGATATGTAGTPRITPARHVVTPRQTTRTRRRATTTTTTTTTTTRRTTTDRPRRHTTRDRTRSTRDDDSRTRSDAPQGTSGATRDGDSDRDDDG